MNYQGMHTQPSFMEENEMRRKRWENFTGGRKSDGNGEYSNGIEKEFEGRVVDPGMVRRCTEIALESALFALSLPQSQGGIGNSKIMNMGLKDIFEEIDSSAIAPFQKFSLGIVRRVVPKLIADGLVSFQPMATPTAPIYYLDLQYGTEKKPTNVGDRLDLISSRNETYAGGRFYDAVGTGNGAQTVFNFAHAGAQSPQVYFDGVLQASPGLTINAGAGPGGVDTGTFAVAPLNLVVVLISYTGYGEGDTPRDIDLELTSKTVEAETIALRAGTTIQTMQNAQAFHNMNVDAELSSAMADELFAEVDALILNELFTFAGAGNVNFNSTGYLPGDTSTADRKAYDATLYDRINDSANLIWAQRHRNPTWIVGGTDAIKRLENLEQYNAFRSPNPEQANIMDARHRVAMGSLGGSQYTIFKDARMPSDKLLLGYKGSSPFDVGYVYAPFIMLYQTGLLADPTANFKMRQGMMHRAGRCRVDMNLYSTVTIL